jgi:hypothetical protein
MALHLHEHLKMLKYFELGHTRAKMSIYSLLFAMVSLKVH